MHPEIITIILNPGYNLKGEKVSIQMEQIIVKMTAKESRNQPDQVKVSLTHLLGHDLGIDEEIEM